MGGREGGKDREIEGGWEEGREGDREGKRIESHLGRVHSLKS